MEITTAYQKFLVAIERRMVTRSVPLLVAIDGGSGAGKSTLAAQLADQLDAALVPGDDFYADHIPDAVWDGYTAAEKVRDGIDWRRLRREALEPLLEARWRPFDFLAAWHARWDEAEAYYFTYVQPPADCLLLTVH